MKWKYFAVAASDLRLAKVKKVNRQYSLAGGQKRSLCQTGDLGEMDQAEEVEEISAGLSDDTLYAGTGTGTDDE